jgi:hypothetical protein
VPQPPTRPATTTYNGTKQLTPQPSDAAAETNSDRHATASQPTETTNKTTNSATKLPHHPNRCEFETWCAASQALTRFNHQPTPPIEHDTRPSCPESTQSARPPEPTTCERTPNRLRELFPLQAPACIPIQRSTSKAPNRPGQHLDIGPVGTWSPTPCFSRCGSLCQLPVFKVRFDLPTESPH